MTTVLFLDLCFKQEMRPVPTEGLPKGDVLVAWLDREGDEAPTPAVTVFDRKELRLVAERRGFPEGYGSRATHRTVETRDFEASKQDLHRLAGFSHLPLTFVSPFRRHHLLATKQHPTRPTFVVFKSMGDLNDDTQTVLYLPPKALEMIRMPKTPTGKALPEEPTFFASVDEACVLLTLLELWRRGDEVAKDCAVTLEVQGVAALPFVRAAVAMERGREMQLPYLVGSLKQIAWASSLRENFITLHLPMRKQHCVSNPWLAPEDTLKGLDEILAEVKYADAAFEWIEHRRDHFAWLKRRVETRKKTLKDNPGLKAILRD